MDTPPISWRPAIDADLPRLAEWNHQLIRDEGHRNPMTPQQLGERMAGWLKGEYKAVLFETATPIGYALYREDAGAIHLRQFFIDRTLRRRGLGQAAFQRLKSEVWNTNLRYTVEVLSKNTPALNFWRKVGYEDYFVCLEILPKP